MSHKINSNSMRLGIGRGWKSMWYAKDQQFADQLHEDLKLRERVRKSLKAAGLDRVEVRRSADKITIDAYVARPGVAIGRGGAGIEDLNKELKKMAGKNVEVNINEIKRPDISASVIATEIASGIERRMPPKLLALSYIAKARAAGAKGIRIWISGRIGGASQARLIKHWDGPVPLHTLKADIDFAQVAAETSDLGKLGVKVWVYKPDNPADSFER